MTAGKLIEGIRKLLKEFNENNEVIVERIDVEVDIEKAQTLDGSRNVDYDFHMTFKK